MAGHAEQRAPGAPLANTNGGSPWPLSDQDLRPGRVRRRVNRRLEGVPSELRPVMRPVTYTMVEVEDGLEVMRDYLDNEFFKSMVNNPRDRFSELVPVYQETGKEAPFTPPSS